MISNKSERKTIDYLDFLTKKKKPQTPWHNWPCNQAKAGCISSGHIHWGKKTKEKNAENVFSKS